MNSLLNSVWYPEHEGFGDSLLCAVDNFSLESQLACEFVLPVVILLDFVAFGYVISPALKKPLQVLWWDQSFIHFDVLCCPSASWCLWVLPQKVLVCVLCRAPVGHLQYYLIIIA